MYDYDFGKQNAKEEDSENVRRYGQPKPPLYPIENVRDLPIALICGLHDMVVAPDDYNITKEVLRSQNSLVEFIEMPFGHVSLLNPDFVKMRLRKLKNNEPYPQENHLEQMYALIRKFNGGDGNEPDKPILDEKVVQEHFMHAD